MTTDRPRLYPGHQHEWTDVEAEPSVWPDTSGLMPTGMVCCTVCGFESPRSLANLDGAMLNDAVYDEPDTEWTPLGVASDEVIEEKTTETEWGVETERTYADGGSSLSVDVPDTDIRCTHRDAAGQCLDHQGHLGDHQHPQETRHA